MKHKIRIAIIGATGFTGLDLVYILSKHPKAKIVNLCATKNIGKKISFFDKRIKKKLPKITKLKNKRTIGPFTGETIKKKLDMIMFKKDDQDTRVKHLYLNERGKKIFNEIFEIQKKRIYNALLKSSSEEVINFDNVLKKIING